jgi:hypothetical protein
VLLLVADGAKTMAQLEALTGATNGPISKAVRTFCPSYDRKSGSVLVPDLGLLQRKRRAPPLRGYALALTPMGESLLEEAGLGALRGRILPSAAHLPQSYGED